MIRILVGDCLVRLKELPDASVDSVVCDPPYHLVSQDKRDGRRASPSEGQRQKIKAGAGFMGQTWDGGDVAFRAETWAEVMRVLKPGGHLVAFSGTRTYHRMAVAIEDAGFEIRDQLAWVYGSGFPKSRNLDGEWQGWGTALKPAWEPIALARKLIVGTVANNVIAHGTGALNIDACRIEHQSEADRASATPQGKVTAKSGALAGKSQNDGERSTFDRPDTSLGRWPANIMHDGSDEVVSAFPMQKSGGTPARRGADGDRNTFGAFAGGEAGNGVGSTSGNASRFFYCAKTSTDERGEGNNHPTVKPIALMQWLCRLVTPPGGTVLDPFMGSGSTMIAAAAEGFKGIGCELSPDYAEIAERRIRAHGGMFAEVTVCAAA